MTPYNTVAMMVVEGELGTLFQDKLKQSLLKEKRFTVLNCTTKQVVVSKTTAAGSNNKKMTKFDKVAVPYQKESGLPELEKGIRFVEMGNYPQAIEKFQSAVAKAKRKKMKSKVLAKAYWNLGLAYEYSWQTARALEHFDKAYALHDDKMFLAEKKNALRLWSERKEMKRRQDSLAFN